MTREQAGSLVAEHNAWLEQQTPIDARLMKAREHMARLTKDMAQAEAALEQARVFVRAVAALVAELETEQKAVDA
jgi:chromosome segregation ATPase